jgi:hypothetical protein
MLLEYSQEMRTFKHNALLMWDVNFVSNFSHFPLLLLHKFSFVWPSTGSLSTIWWGSKDAWSSLAFPWFNDSISS